MLGNALSLSLFLFLSLSLSLFLSFSTLGPLNCDACYNLFVLLWCDAWYNLFVLLWCDAWYNLFVLLQRVELRGGQKKAPTLDVCFLGVQDQPVSNALSLSLSFFLSLSLSLSRVDAMMFSIQIANQRSFNHGHRVACMQLGSTRSNKKNRNTTEQLARHRSGEMDGRKEKGM